MSDTRRVHARNADGTVEVVRYDRAGKWCLERQGERRRRVIIGEAVAAAVEFHGGGGKVFLWRTGGSTFDRLCIEAGVRS